MLTYDGANALLSLLVGNAGSTYRYNNVYMGLSTTAPNRDGTGITEPSVDAGYYRVLIGKGDAGEKTICKMDTCTLGATTNKDFIYFPEATGSWGTCTHFFLASAVEGGTVTAYGALTDEISPVNGTVPIVRIGDLDMSIS